MNIITKQNIIRDLLFICILLLGDLITKYLFFNQQILSSLSLIEPAINDGISFSLALSSLVVLPMTIVSLLFFCYMYSNKIFPRRSLVLLFAGTLGNFYDRIVYDGVRDFLVFPHRFIFNLADIFLFVGIVWACIYMIGGNSEKKKR